MVGIVQKNDVSSLALSCLDYIKPASWAWICINCLLALHEGEEVELWLFLLSSALSTFLPCSLGLCHSSGRNRDLGGFLKFVFITDHKNINKLLSNPRIMHKAVFAYKLHIEQ